MSERHHKAGQAIDAQRDGLAEAIVARQYELQRNCGNPMAAGGRGNRSVTSGYHLTYLVGGPRDGQSCAVCRLCCLGQGALCRPPVVDEVLLTTLECTRDALQEELTADSSAIASEYVALGLDHCGKHRPHCPTFLERMPPWAAWRGGISTRSCEGERRIASQLVLDAVEQGTSIKDVYIHVFQRSQYEIGRLWQMNRITVAQEHYCTAATQLIMSQLYPYLFGTDRIGRRLVATCVGDELHELGMRMVADFFEMEGWDTYYVGANAPAESILQTVEERQADVLGISATMTFHVREVAALIALVRQTPAPEASGSW